MNWYKLANLFEEIERFGPESPINGLNDPRVQYISNIYNITPNEAFMKLTDTTFNVTGNEDAKRKYFTDEYSWSVPNQEAIEKIKAFVDNDNVVEIGSGRGLWAKLMQDAEISITPTDSFEHSKRQHNKWRGKRYYTDIEDIEAEQAINKYGSYNVLMMSWPPYESPMANSALKSFKGNKLIFIGEGRWGCVANDDFFDTLNNEWKEVERIEISQWDGMHDELSLWVRK